MATTSPASKHAVNASKNAPDDPVVTTIRLVGIVVP